MARSAHASPNHLWPSNQAIAVRAPRHEILFCSDDTAILDGLTRFIAVALKGGNAGIVWATDSHRSNLLQNLQRHSVDVDGAIRQGTYIAADVSEPPDAARIVASINALKEAAAKTGNTHPRVAVCGERAGLLWAEGQNGFCDSSRTIFKPVSQEP